MAWLQLLIAGIFEVVWAVALKDTHGFTKLVPSIVTIIGMSLSFYFLSQALKTLPIGTAYAIWTGIGALGTVIYGILYLGEPATIIRLACIVMLISAMVGLKLTSL